MGRFSLLTSLVVLFTLSLAIRPDQLDIQLNLSLFEGSPKMVSYGVIVEITGLKDWEDKHILDLAFVAHERFLSQYQRDFDERKYTNPSLRLDDRPRVTTTMIIDDTAYISTSLKGKRSYIYNPALNDIKNDHPCEGPVLDGLRRCQQRSIEIQGKTAMHRTLGKCGEYMAALAYCVETAQQGDLSKAKIVSIFRKSDTENVLIPPCDRTSSGPSAPENEWGCSEFTKEVNMHVVTDEGGREPKDVDDKDIQPPKQRTVYP